MRVLTESGTKSNGVEAGRKTLASDGQPMEGNSVRSRLWSLILRELPFPLRWLGLETVRVLRWLDHGAGRIARGLRESPAWHFVTLVGALGVFLTILLFISLSSDSSGYVPSTYDESSTHLTRHDLEQINEWTVQDRWRVAHLFVLHKPAHQPQNPPIDSRLIPVEDRNEQRGARTFRGRPAFVQRSHASRDIDVRLDLSRPKKAQQGNRVVEGTVFDPGPNFNQRPAARIQTRDPRLLVQASWEFGSDCNRTEYVSVPPVRRLVPVPEPIIDEPRPAPIPVRRTHPDLAFEMDLVRHFSTAGQFPAGAHLVTKSARSVFPDDDLRFQSELVSHRDDNWRRASENRHSHHDGIKPYLGVGTYDALQGVHETSDESDQSLAAVAEVGLAVELVAPRSAGASQPQHSKLLVINEGQDLIPRIEIRDFVGHLQTVVGADPEALIETSVDPETGLKGLESPLHREIHGLVPGGEREFSLRWIPDGQRRQIHRAQVIAHAAVSTTTEVSRPPEPDPDQQMPSIPPELPPARHPALACDIQHLERVRVGDEIELAIAVRNTGDTTLHGVKVRVEIPSQFAHREGRKVVFDAGTLPVRGRNQTVLRMSALHAGEAFNVLHVDAVEKVEARGRSRIEVVARMKEKDPAPPLPDSPRPQPKPPAPPVSKPLRVTPLPVDECCCQKITNLSFEPGSQLP